ncbi:hypothetical protein GTP58_28340 [Duganella sp. CY15W]|uniref:hypothetical protein n=1 Tax=Duganella sp. CY15W TaxID=2692172 RepID=UPI0013709CD8|nr:hypothetical protein [Duganella sp. CY15W]MYM32248.1 hypothetical protein [Duganella sp. CY15W]
MSVDVSISQMLTGCFGLILLCLGFFVRQWMSRLQADLDSAKKAHSELASHFHDYQLQCARDFAAKADVANGRQEMVEAMHEVSRKVDRLFDKLDMKADKQ